MERISRTIDIDLSKYGMTGHVIMSRPSFAKRNEVKNQLTKYVKRDREGTIVEERRGDMQIIGMLAYIESAPFSLNYRSFMEFMARMDAVNMDYTEPFYTELLENVKKIDAGELSPFVTSPPPEKETSE